MTERVAVSMDVNIGFAALSAICEAKKKHSSKRITDDLARDYVLSALSRAARYDQQSRLNLPPDAYPELVCLTLSIGPPTGSSLVKFEVTK